MYPPLELKLSCKKFPKKFTIRHVSLFLCTVIESTVYFFNWSSNVYTMCIMRKYVGYLVLTIFYQVLKQSPKWWIRRCDNRVVKKRQLRSRIDGSTPRSHTPLEVSFRRWQRTCQSEWYLVSSSSTPCLKQYFFFLQGDYSHAPAESMEIAAFLDQHRAAMRGDRSGNSSFFQ